MHPIVIENINKTFGEITALNDINLNVEKGELLGLIGPDGAGKTTLIRILTTLILPDSGTAFVDGYDIIKDYKKIRESVGYMPGRFSLYMDLTVEENITLYAKIFGTTVEENYHLVKDIYSQIEPFKDRQAGKLSGGMKQKLALSCALIHKPHVLFLDEPTTGVDPVSRAELWDMLKNLKSQGITILASTAYMDEAKLCDRVALIDKGTFLSVDTVPNIISQFDRSLFAVKGDNNHKLLNALKLYEHTEMVYPFGEHLHLSLKEESDANGINAFLSSYIDDKITVTKIKPDIEDCFIHLMTADE